MSEPVIITARRTAIGKVGGMFSHVPSEQLVSPLIQNILEETSLNPSEVDDVILGNATGPGGNLARLCALEADLPFSVPGVTIDRQCGSGLEAIQMAARFVQAGAGEVYLAGGVESSSTAPWKIEKPANLYHPAGPSIYTKARFSPGKIGDPGMGEAAENVAERYGISRKDQDEYAFYSHQKATEAIENGRFKEEIVPVQGIVQDECVRWNTSVEKLAELSPVFKEQGTVTAGNACPINDGAALVLIMSKEKANALDVEPGLTFRDSVCCGVDPHYLGIGPIPAVTRLLGKQDLKVDDIDAVEFNEAFASQVLASIRNLSIPAEKVNRGGGAIALGHPYGASGAILVSRLFHEMKSGDLKRGLATLGIGGGMGLAALFESG
ncbi:thiolase family protein [Halobacillus mangrovi]|uniref:Acetyl-CoA acetyltransferase n=1 Tax=Halobacillus mangrovi TaxID=402384 RepID=A0A1W5ZVR7_9BACI|nr:thiolase family protein [Halobacillus mangrovi]ARI77359.1 acetyl-CoA acetyltransferase [Halobacillus mangrovi]